MRRSYLVSAVFALLVATSVGAPSTPATAFQRARRTAPTEQGSATNPVPVIWQQRTRIRELDFVGGPGGREHAPRPPFTFVEEDTGGSNPKIEVKDANGRRWGVKWGTEVNAETFATRVAWAAGYFVEPAYFVPRGRVEGVNHDQLDRAKKYVAADGSFADARFELKVDVLKKLKDEQGWAWDKNPFVGRPELNGLKIVMMLISNWDSKDVRDVSRGSNTAIYVVQTRSRVEARYLITDWGGSMGKWGNYFSREKWDADGFAKQTPDFVKGVENGYVRFGYTGQRTDDVRDGIRVSDVQWLMRSVGRITDAQIRDGLRASGATPQELEMFARNIRSRIERLRTLR